VVINAQTKEVIDDTLIDVKFSGVSWRGNAGFYYSSYDNPKETSELSAKTQHHKLYYHVLGTSQSGDLLVYGGEKQPNRYIGGSVTEDQNYLVISAAQNTSGNQIYVQDLTDPNSSLIQLQDDYFADCGVVINDGSTFFLYTNIGAPNYRLIAGDLSRPDQKTWRDVIPETDHVLRVNSGGEKFFANYLIDVKSVVKQYDYEGNFEWDIKLPAIGSAGGFGAKKYEHELYYSFSSFTYPTTIFHYDIPTGKSTLYRKPDVDFEPADYTIDQIFYKSGKYINATLDKASDENERNYVKMTNSNGDDLILVQIAGIIARRIVCEVKENEETKQGNKFGIIRFGSRVDLYFENYQLMIRQNQKTIAGETIIAKKK